MVTVGPAFATIWRTDPICPRDPSTGRPPWTPAETFNIKSMNYPSLAQKMAAISRALDEHRRGAPRGVRFEAVFYLRVPFDRVGDPPS
jgi:hypothetical protein